ncbi:MAG: HAMP domain-containing histidine kinase [Lachnospiraceae bacterium]|nr:HAMP domain-containing histidine kinase [Lachnospiraceae bacterium]
MSNKQKVLLVGACVLFAATVYSLFYFEIYLIILFFLLHSLCLIGFSYLTYSNASRDERFIETYHQDIGMEIAAKENEISDLKAHIEQTERSLQDSRDENGELLKQLEETKEQLSGLEEEKTRMEEKIKEESSGRESAVMGLLPSEDENGDGRETINIIAVAKQACDELMDSARRVGLHVSVSSQGDTLLVRADRNRIITLFRNIIDNSIKYMRRAGSLVITISTIGDDIFIVLKDTGEGLPEDETRHIFELNFQGSNRISGNGLGLAQAKAIVECYGGTIYAKSTEGKGMGIYIQLPA